MLLTLAILISIAAMIWIGFDLFKIITKHQSKRQLYMPIIIFIIALAQRSRLIMKINKRRRNKQ